MPLKTIGLLILSSVLNAAVGVGCFLFSVFATGPELQDVTMRIGYYVLNGIVVAAVVGIFGPWYFALKNHSRIAMFLATLPILLTCLAIVSFLTLDSWLQRTFSG